MRDKIIRIGFILVLMTAVCSYGQDDLSKLVEEALAKAGDNAGELGKALDEVGADQKEGMQFLIAYMPERDLQNLSAEYLLNNVRFAYKAWNESPWKGQVDKEMFFNDVLPYASINERRDDWREDFYKRFMPLVAEAKTPGEAAIILNREAPKILNVRFSRGRRRADQSPYETIETGMASCTGLSVLMVDVCRSVGVPARFAGTPLWTDRSGNHSWMEVWDNGWYYAGAAEPADKLNEAWFTGKAKTAQRDSRLNAIYATSFKKTELKFPMVWTRRADYVYAVNVTDRYTGSEEKDEKKPPAEDISSRFDVEASLHAVAQLKDYLKTARDERGELAKQDFASVALTREDTEKAEKLLWGDHVERIRSERAGEMKNRVLVDGDLKMPFYYKIFGDKPGNGRSLFISMHGGGGAPKRVNDRQWENQKGLYEPAEGVYLAPRAPTDAWNLWHQGHIDGMFDRLIEDLIVFEDVDPDRVYLMGYSAGGDGVYQLAPRMADRFAAASMMAGHPNEAQPMGLRNLPFSIQVGGNDSAYNRNKVAGQWAEKLDALQKEDPDGYIHWSKIYEGKGHWMDKEDAAAVPWMAKYDRNPLPKRIAWRQDDVTGGRFYWLAVREEDQRKDVEVRADLKGQQFDIQSEQLKQITIRVNDSMLNLDEEITVNSQGKQIYKGRVKRAIGTLYKTLAERGDPKSVFSSEIEVKLTD